jgi:hypothetical protein
LTDLIVPRDPRPQFSELAVMLANNKLGRQPLAGVEKVGPDRYVVANWWPSTTNRRASGGSSPAGSVEVQPVREEPKSGAAARALWPDLK